MLIGARDLAKGEAAAAELKKEGVDARAVKLDVVNSADYEAAAKLIEKEYGELDILINNAGIMFDGRKGMRRRRHRRMFCGRPSIRISLRWWG